MKIFSIWVKGKDGISRNYIVEDDGFFEACERVRDFMLDDDFIEQATQTSSIIVKKEDK